MWNYMVFQRLVTDWELIKTLTVWSDSFCFPIAKEKGQRRPRPGMRRAAGVPRRRCGAQKNWRRQTARQQKRKVIKQKRTGYKNNRIFHKEGKNWQKSHFPWQWMWHNYNLIGDIVVVQRTAMCARAKERAARILPPRGKRKLVYICDNCRFLFERQGEVFQCPDCGSGHIRPAVETEIAEYKSRRQSEEQWAPFFYLG